MKASLIKVGDAVRKIGDSRIGIVIGIMDDDRVAIGFGGEQILSGTAILPIDQVEQIAEQ